MSTEKVENQIEEEVQEEVEVDVKLEEADTPTQESSSETQEDQKNDEPVEASATTEGEEAEQGGGKQGKTKFQKRIDELSQGVDPDVVIDGRTKSVLLEADPLTGDLILTLCLEESADLVTWDPVEDVYTRKIALPEGKNFYRFSVKK